MPEIQQQRERSYSESGVSRGGDAEYWFRSHMSHATQTAEEFRTDGSLEKYSVSMARVKCALSVAKKTERPDLEQEAQHAMKKILEIAETQRREAMKVLIIAAASKKPQMEVKFESFPETGSAKRLVSVAGVPIDDVIQLLDQDEKGPSSSIPGPSPVSTDQYASEEDYGDEWLPFTGCEQKAASKGARVYVANAATGICDPHTPPVITDATGDGRLIRDIRGRLATVLTEAPKLRRKPNFTD